MGKGCHRERSEGAEAMLSIMLLLAQTGDTLRISTIPHPPPAYAGIDSVALGDPTLRIRTRQGSARVWILRATDTVFIAAAIPDTTPYWDDDFVLSLDTRGDAAPTVQHDDFQLYFRRVLDSSVVFRGRNGRWEPPRGDPDWRLGIDRSGGGWEVSGTNDSRGWTLLLRLDHAWFAGESGRRARIAIRVYDDSPGGWFSWPLPPPGRPATVVEDSPELWRPVQGSLPNR
jgi:hypothetical protein